MIFQLCPNPRAETHVISELAAWPSHQPATRTTRNIVEQLLTDTQIGTSVEFNARAE